jgi:hypothetical protein
MPDSANVINHTKPPQLKQDAIHKITSTTPASSHLNNSVVVVLRVSVAAVIRPSRNKNSTQAKKSISISPTIEQTSTR